MPKSLANISAEALIGDVLAAHPLAAGVIEKYFGGVCLTCPGTKMETIAFGAKMHGLDPAPVLKELRELPDVE